MRWVKIVLIVQAIAVILMGVAFITQLISIDNSKISEATLELSKGNSPFDDEPSQVFEEIKTRYTLAAFILPIIGLLEIIILSRVS